MANYEEKYKNALSQAKQAINNIPDESLAKWLQSIFPELQESDDEKMRAWLIEYFDKVNDEISKDDRQKIIAWLGKQEQKSVWSEEDEKIIKGIIDDIQGRLENYPIEQLAEIYFKEISWLKCLKERIQPQLKQDWKPSDEQMRELGIVATGMGWFNKDVLSGLLEQLKKLREE